MKNTYVIIMAGGIGSRFWPASKKSMPKQFLDVMGVGQSLIQLTYNRFVKKYDKEKILIVTNSEYKDLVIKHLPDIKESQILLEPSAKNTAPCLAYASFRINALDPDANCIVAPSDHIILDETSFNENLYKALDFVDKTNALVTLGIKPSRPDTGYGYIQYLKESNDTDMHKVKLFTEKPSQEIAQQFIESGDFLWNAGIFVWNNRTIMTALESLLPEIHELFSKGKSNFGTANEQHFINEIYPQCKNISIDYGVMEKADNVFVIPSEFGWSDLGTWKSLYKERDTNIDGNVIHGKRCMVYDTKDSLIFSNTDKLIVVNGVENIMIIDSGEVIMVSSLDKEQEVKNIVTDVKNKYKDYYS